MGHTMVEYQYQIWYHGIASIIGTGAYTRVRTVHVYVHVYSSTMVPNMVHVYQWYQWYCVPMVRTMGTGTCVLTVHVRTYVRTYVWT
jgi:hypothetical protein